MGVLNRYRADVSRVGAELAAGLGCELEDARPGEPTRKLRSTRGDRSMCIDLNEVHGIHGVACAIRALPLPSLQLTDERSLFARGPKVTEHLQVNSLFDDEALWRRLPDGTRSAIVELLGPPSSMLMLAAEELSATLGPIGLLRDPDAAARILASLDRLIVIAGAVEEHWSVDPRTVGGGFLGGARAARPPVVAEPRPRDVRACDPVTIAAAAHAARDALVAAHAALIMEPFPAIDPIRGDLAAIAGRVVLLPPAAPSQWVRDIGCKVVVAGDAASGRYVARSKDPGLARVLRAAERYERATGTALGDAPYALVARVTGKPRVVVVDHEGVVGLDVATLGALIGDRVFVDAAEGGDGEARFAGED